MCVAIYFFIILDYSQASLVCRTLINQLDYTALLCRIQSKALQKKMQQAADYCFASEKELRVLCTLNI